ncbi:hypothetical protein CsSME_00040417 [Camellia sinensis var. sinensis]
MAMHISHPIMADPLTALMYAVQVMNFLKSLIVKTLRDREDSLVEPARVSHLEPSDENGHHSPSQPFLEDSAQENDDLEPSFIAQEPALEKAHSDSTSVGESFEDCETPIQIDTVVNEIEAKLINGLKSSGQSSVSNLGKGLGIGQQTVLQVMGLSEKSKEISNLSRINSRTQRIEAWR